MSKQAGTELKTFKYTKYMIYLITRPYLRINIETIRYMKSRVEESKRQILPAWLLDICQHVCARISLGQTVLFYHLYVEVGCFYGTNITGCTILTMNVAMFNHFRESPVGHCKFTRQLAKKVYQFYCAG